MPQIAIFHSRPVAEEYEIAATLLDLRGVCGLEFTDASMVRKVSITFDEQVNEEDIYGQLDRYVSSFA